MAYQFTYTERFKKSFAKLSANEKSQTRAKLGLLSQNPTHPSLRTKRIQGTENLYECSVNMDIRMIWYIEGSKIIMLLDIGHHDILKQY
jgi:mRNA interferase RelE/StbE